MYFNNVILKIKQNQKRKTWQKYFKHGIKVFPKSFFKFFFFAHKSSFSWINLLGAETL